MSTNHVVIEFDPAAQYEWNRCLIRHSLGFEGVDLKELVEKQLSKPGQYLAKVSISVEVLEFNPALEPEVTEEEAEYLASIAA